MRRSTVQVLLLSTYDLGRQPFGLASPAAWLREAGCTVRVRDLAVSRLDEREVREAERIAVHLPMHTATRIAARLLPRLRRLNPEARLAAYGLYAPGNEAHLRRLGAERVFGGEFEAALTGWATGEPGEPEHAVSPPGSISLERLDFRVPDRAGLADHAHYAHVVTGTGEKRRVGYTEASRGCKHACRHCPVVPVYGGRFRIVPREIVLEDARRQVAAGARHLTFGDPDFFNGPGHAIPLVEALHREFPELSYDVTIKIEHLRRHDALLPRLVETGCLFVTSAVESVDDAVLRHLDKGHTEADFRAVVERFGELGLTLHPTFVAFTPWTTAAGHAELLETIAALDLVEHVAPVQWALRLLIPAGSRLLELAEIRGLVGPFEEAALVHPWRHPDPSVDELQRRLEGIVARGTAEKVSRRALFARVHAETARAAGREPPVSEPAGTAEPRAPVPYLSEPWYC